MTNDNDVNLLSDELHELADGIAPSVVARYVPRRGSIARRARNRRAAVSAPPQVVVVAAVCS